MQNPDNNVPDNQSEATQQPKGLKGKLKSLFNLKSLKGFAKASAQKVWNNKSEIAVGMATSGLFKIGVTTLCTASLLGSTSGIIMMGASTGAVVAAAKYGFNYIRADQEARKNFNAKELGKKMAWGAGFGLLGNTVGSYLAHHLNCFGGKFFSAKDSFITAHQADTLPGGHITQPAPSVLHDTPPVAQIADANPVTPPAPAAPEIAATTPAPATPDAVTAASPAPVTPEHAAPSAPASPDTGNAIAAATPTPVPVVPVSPLDAIKDYAAHNHVSAKLKDALTRADSTNVRVRAQALDDIAVYAPKDLRIQAYELLKKSAGMGNMKAKADLITMEFYGNKALGIKANPEAAVDKMVALSKHSKFAAKMVDQWVGPEHTAPVVTTAAPAIEHFNIPAGSTDVVTVDITTSEITQPIVVGGPIDMTNVTTVEIPATPMPPVVQPVTHVTAPAPALSVAPDCAVYVDPKNIENLVMTCDVTADIDLNLGDEIYVKRPAAAWAMQPR